MNMLNFMEIKKIEEFFLGRLINLYLYLINKYFINIYEIFLFNNYIYFNIVLLRKKNYFS